MELQFRSLCEKLFSVHGVDPVALYQASQTTLYVAGCEDSDHGLVVRVTGEYTCEWAVILAASLYQQAHLAFYNIETGHELPVAYCRRGVVQ